MNKITNPFAKFLIVGVLVLFHVCASAYTVNNPLNPLLILMMITYTAWSEFITYFVGGMIIQCVVTSFLSYFILEWRNYKVWLISFLICLCLQIYLTDFLINYHSQIIDLSCINEFDDKIGMEYYINNVIFFSIIQLLYLILYQLLSSLFPLFNVNHCCFKKCRKLKGDNNETNL